MATDRQIEANRKNSEKCTGPTSVDGKKKSSQNALKTGLDAKSEVIRCENRADYETLIAEYYAHFRPIGPEERCLVDTLIRSEWFGRRYMSVEAAVWERDFNLASTSLGLSFVRQSDPLARVDRRINSAQRSFQQALKQLREIQSKRPPEPIPAEELAPELVSFAISEPLARIQPTPAPENAPETPAFDPQTEEDLPLAA